MTADAGATRRSVRVVTELVDLATQLRERNRAYGRASAEIGRLRDRLARVLLERAQDRAASPGTVNGDVLAEVLQAAAPERWTKEARAEFAEQVLRDMVPSGFRIYRGPGQEPWPATVEAPSGPEVAEREQQSLPYAVVPGMHLRWYQGGIVRRVTSVRPNPTATYGVDVFVDEDRVTRMGPLELGEWSWQPIKGDHVAGRPYNGAPGELFGTYVEAVGESVVARIALHSTGEQQEVFADTLRPTTKDGA